jgi:hypothetical protein
MEIRWFSFSCFVTEKYTNGFWHWREFSFCSACVWRRCAQFVLLLKVCVGYLVIDLLKFFPGCYYEVLWIELQQYLTVLFLTLIVNFFLVSLVEILFFFSYVFLVILLKANWRDEIVLQILQPVTVSWVEVQAVIMLLVCVGIECMLLECDSCGLDKSVASKNYDEICTVWWCLML